MVPLSCCHVQRLSAIAQLDVANKQVCACSFYFVVFDAVMSMTGKAFSRDDIDNPIFDESVPIYRGTSISISISILHIPIMDLEKL